MSVPRAERDSPRPPASPGRAQKWFVGCLSSLAFLVSYLVSAGPMVALHRAVQADELRRIIEIVYAPLVFAVKHNLEPVASIMKWYLGLFR